MVWEPAGSGFSCLIDAELRDAETRILIGETYPQGELNKSARNLAGGYFLFIMSKKLGVLIDAFNSS